jgi:hypothetical protein
MSDVVRPALRALAVLARIQARWHACGVTRLTVTTFAALAILSSPLLFVPMGCGAGSSPGEVAEDFWRAVAEGELDEARRLVIEDDARGMRRLAAEGIRSVEVGEVLTEDDAARVETRLERERGTLSFPTHLHRFDQGWRVDARASGQAYRRAVVEASLAELSGAFSEGAGAIGEAVEQGLREASEALRSALDELEGERPPSPQPRP